MNFRYLKNMMAVATFAVAALSLGSCVGDLDVSSINPTTPSDFDQAKVFTKIYAGFSLTGQTGPNGDQDISDIDEGTSDLLRQIWNSNELTTDEAHCAWGDTGIPEYNHNAWSDSHSMLKGLYYRLYFSITLCNNFLTLTADESDATTKMERAEVRFIRALDYYYLMDMFGNVAFTTVVSKENPPQKSRAEVFAFVESELKDCVTDMAEPRANTYGRVDKAAAWLLLARLYLNAKVYTGTAHWADAASYAKQVMNSGYKLCTTAKGNYSAYQLLFMGDNNTNGAQDEDIFPVLYDGVDTQSYGGMFFLIASTRTGDEGSNGSSEHWAGNRARKNLIDKFFPNDNAPASSTSDIITAAKDSRALFYGTGRTVSVEKEGTFSSGFSCVKFTGVHSDGSATHDSKFTDTDYPFMRVAEAYLTYAEALIRANNDECTAEAASAINAVRARANAKQASTYTLDEVLDEWSREFWFEGRRRIDLIRFGLYGGQSTYKWEWMGGAYAGSQFSANYNIFPIPSSDLNANHNLVQNTGY
jgi:hypothetical protein